MHQSFDHFCKIDQSCILCIVLVLWHTVSICVSGSHFVCSYTLLLNFEIPNYYNQRMCDQSGFVVHSEQVLEMIE